MAAKAKKRKCKAKTKAGKACRSFPQPDSDLCMAHSPKEYRESRGFRPDNGKGGRPKNPRVIDVLRERIEERMDEVIDVYLEAMKAQDVVVHGTGKDREVEHIPDHTIRLRAVEALNDRAYGKPAQAVELAGKDGGPVAASIDVDDPEVRKLAAKLLRRRVEAQ